MVVNYTSIRVREIKTVFTTKTRLSLNEDHDGVGRDPGQRSWPKGPSLDCFDDHSVPCLRVDSLIDSFERHGSGQKHHFRQRDAVDHGLFCDKHRMWSVVWIGEECFDRKDILL